MSKTFGSKDLKPRKKRTHYRGKLIKKKRKSDSYVKYVSKREDGDPIKAMIFEKRVMSTDGYNRWNKNLKPVIKKFVFYPVRIDESEKPYLLLLDPEDISSPEKIEETFLNIIEYGGLFQLRLPTHRKNKGHVSFCKKCDVRITESDDGMLNAKAFNTFNLSMYWFWDSRRKKANI